MCCNLYLSILYTHTSSCGDYTKITAASFVGTFVIAFLLGAAIGAIAVFCTMNKKSYGITSSENQNPSLEPVYDRVSEPTQNQAIELEENVAYGPVQEN